HFVYILSRSLDCFLCILIFSPTTLVVNLSSFNDTTPTVIYTLSLHDALPILYWPPSCLAHRVASYRNQSHTLGIAHGVVELCFSRHEGVELGGLRAWQFFRKEHVKNWTLERILPCQIPFLPTCLIVHVGPYATHEKGLHPAPQWERRCSPETA